MTAFCGLIAFLGVAARDAHGNADVAIDIKTASRTEAAKNPRFIIIPHTQLPIQPIENSS